MNLQPQAEGIAAVPLMGARRRDDRARCKGARGPGGGGPGQHARGLEGVATGYSGMRCRMLIILFPGHAMAPFFKLPETRRRSTLRSD